MKEAAAWCCGMVGRLAPGVTPAQAQQDAGRVARQITRNFPAYMSSQRIGAMVRPLAEETVAQARPLLRILFLAVAVGAVHRLRQSRWPAAGARDSAATGDSGAAGAGRERRGSAAAESRGNTRVERCGSLIGLGLAALAVRVGISFLPETLPRVESIRLDWHVVLFAMGTALLTGLLCGLVPRWPRRAQA